MPDQLYKANILISGAVQGVGFRPFVFKLAKNLGIKGYVLNSDAGVEIVAVAQKEIINKFIFRLQTDKPDISYIKNFDYNIIPFNKEEEITDFKIIRSKTNKEPTTYIMPDIATCEDCLKEVFNPNDRRYLYPFTNCTNCGPRYTIIERLPYDRENTSMKNFIMCKECKEEYENPENRRFHAQPNACPVCGPKVIFWDESGKFIADKQEAIELAVEKILNGKIVAVKGLGGFHLFVNPYIKSSILTLRKRKHRNEKPFAIMFPDLQTIQKYCIVSDFEKRLLTSQKSPIVLLKIRRKYLNAKAEPDLPFFKDCVGEYSNNPYLGVLLPYTPLHHILLRLLNIPVIATSGNISDEPICTDEIEALERLNGIADFFLVHNRPILRYVDDSIVKVIAGEEFVLRRARGYAPLPITIESSEKDNEQVISTGAFLKNTVALKKENEVFISQHIGDLDNLESINAFEKTISHLSEIYKIKPSKIICDLHPDFPSSKYAEEISKLQNIKIVKIQHHIAHIYSCIAENKIDLPVLGISWDGTGYGLDSTIWGSEFFKIDSEVNRIAHLRYFRLPGGEEAIKNVNRIAAGILIDFQDELKLQKPEKFLKIEKHDLQLLRKILERGINSPYTSSMGRLFDAVSSLIDIKQYSSFEGQAAMELEFIAYNASEEKGTYNFEIIKNNGICIINFIPIIKSILIDRSNDIPVNIISAKFHNTLVEIIVTVAQKHKIKNVALSGGCFQNSILLEKSIQKLKELDFNPYWQKRIPVNDGGISLGQIAYPFNF
ncbi:MAG: carbamoyltransferase HypF [Ignavibacteria bacterium]|nr:carbamoyltransferase HypF [Ignavibacteria bacterium]